jgi:hypothetical protein
MAPRSTPSTIAGHAGAPKIRQATAGAIRIGGLVELLYQLNSYDLMVSEFTLHHLPDF